VVFANGSACRSRRLCVLAARLSAPVRATLASGLRFISRKPRRAAPPSRAVRIRVTGCCRWTAALCGFGPPCLGCAAAISVVRNFSVSAYSPQTWMLWSHQLRTKIGVRCGFRRTKAQAKRRSGTDGGRKTGPHNAETAAPAGRAIRRSPIDFVARATATASEALLRARGCYSSAPSMTIRRRMSRSGRGVGLRLRSIVCG